MLDLQIQGDDERGVKKLMDKQTFSVSETAKILGISRGLAYQLAKEGKIPVLKLGTRMVVPRIKLEQFINS